MPAESLKAANSISSAKANAGFGPASSDLMPSEPGECTAASTESVANTGDALDLSLTRIVGSTGAAVTAAFLGSRLGVAGTLIGAALASVISVVGGALYTQSLTATGQRMAKVITGGRQAPVRASRQVGRRGSSRGGSRQGGFRRPSLIGGRVSLGGGLLAAALAVCVFAGALIVVTGYESVSGAPLSGGPAGGLTILGGQPAAPWKATGAPPETSDSVPPASPSPSSPGVVSSGPSTSPIAPTAATSSAPATTGPVAGAGSVPTPGSAPSAVTATLSATTPGPAGSLPPSAPVDGPPPPVTAAPGPGLPATSAGAGPDSNPAPTSGGGAATSTPPLGMVAR